MIAQTLLIVLAIAALALAGVVWWLHWAFEYLEEDE